MNVHNPSSPSYESSLIKEAIAHYSLDHEPTILVGNSGMNNTTRVIVDGDKRYNLRIYNNHQDKAKLQFEHQMLFLLQQQSIQLATPIPVYNKEGSTITQLAGGKLASMFHYIDGDRPSLQLSAHISGLGAAAAKLSLAFANVKVDAQPAYSPYYELANNYEPLTIERLQTLFEADEQLLMIKDKFLLIMQERERLEQKYKLFASLPMQWIHGDINSSNSLALAEKVVAIIDFEFVTKDARVMELAVLLSEMIKPEEINLEERLHLMKQSYCQHITLLSSEHHALHDLIKLRAVDVAMHFIGRYEEGLDHISTLQGIISDAHFTLDYMEEHPI